MGLADPSRSSSSPTCLRAKSRFSMCFSCCFPAGAYSCEEERPPSLIRSSTTWIRSKAKELPEFGGKCRNLVAMVKRHHHNRRRRCCGRDFRYDPLSYAQNFDEGPDYDDEYEDGPAAEFRYRNFSSRLPATPSPPAPRPAVGVA